MKHVRLVSIILCAIMLLLAACKQEPLPPAEPLPSTVPTEAPVKIVPSAVEPTPSAGSQVTEGISPITGLPYDGEYEPVAVMIENEKAARPQAGLQAASVVYESLVEGNITRFMCIFNEEIPDSVGPVRSARIPFVDIVREWDIMYVHFGANSVTGSPANVYDYIAGHPIKIRLDGNRDHKDTIYRDNSLKAPHNAFLDLPKARGLYDYQPETHPFRFTQGSDTFVGNEPAKAVDIYYIGSTFSRYEYDEESGLYARFNNKDPHIDKLTGEQVGVKNLIIQAANYGLYTDEIRSIELAGSGEGVYICEGYAKKIKWEKDGGGRTLYMDENGQEIELMPGNTWIHIVPQFGRVEIGGENAEG